MLPQGVLGGGRSTALPWFALLQASCKSNQCPAAGSEDPQTVLPTHPTPCQIFCPYNTLTTQQSWFHRVWPRDTASLPVWRPSHLPGTHSRCLQTGPQPGWGEDPPSGLTRHGCPRPEPRAPQHKQCVLHICQRPLGLKPGPASSRGLTSACPEWPFCGPPAHLFFSLESPPSSALPSPSSLPFLSPSFHPAKARARHPWGLRLFICSIGITIQ